MRTLEALCVFVEGENELVRLQFIAFQAASLPISYPTNRTLSAGRKGFD
jgi:hypothetical protein